LQDAIVVDGAKVEHRRRYPRHLNIDRHPGVDVAPR